MKKITSIALFGLILFLSRPTNAQTMIAVTNETGSTFYTSLDLAITNAKSGDYIYLPGGSFTISVPINKQLQIVGVGHNPDSCAVTGITQVTGNFTIKSGSDHGSITGIKIDAITFTVGATEPIINYYSIERCNIGGLIFLSSKSSNILINECVIRSSYIIGYNTQGFQMSKCIIETNDIRNFDSNAYFINNIFIFTQTGSSIGFDGITNCYVRNNIFLSSVRDAGYQPNCPNNLFQNNLFNSGVGYFQSSNLFRNNITGPVTPLFKNQSGKIFDYKQDYHILDTSPAHNAGTDGTDLGIYGTGSPWKEGSVPSNPHIQSKSISTVNGNLNVKIKVAAQDY